MKYHVSSHFATVFVIYHLYCRSIVGPGTSSDSLAREDIRLVVSSSTYTITPPSTCQAPVLDYLSCVSMKGTCVVQPRETLVVLKDFQGCWQSALFKRSWKSLSLHCAPSFTRSHSAPCLLCGGVACGNSVPFPGSGSLAMPPYRSQEKLRGSSHNLSL